MGFRKGDIVRVIKGSSHVGEIGIVTYVMVSNSTLWGHYEVEINNHIYGFMEWQLEKVQS